MNAPAEGKNSNTDLRPVYIKGKNSYVHFPKDMDEQAIGRYINQVYDQIPENNLGSLAAPENPNLPKDNWMNNRYMNLEAVGGWSGPWKRGMFSIAATYGETPGVFGFDEEAKWWENKLKGISPTPAGGRYAKGPETLADWIDPVRIYNAVGEGLPITAAFAAVTAVSPILGTALMGMAEGGSVSSDIRAYEEETGEKVDFKTRAVLTIGVGAFNAALEKTGLDAILDKGPFAKVAKRRIMRWLIGAATEAGTEGIQSLNSDLSQLGYRDEVSPSLWDNFKKSFYGGLMVGGLGGPLLKPIANTVDTFVNPNKGIQDTPEFRKAVQEQINERKNKGKVTLSPEEVNLPKKLAKPELWPANTDGAKTHLTPSEEIIISSVEPKAALPEGTRTGFEAGPEGTRPIYPEPSTPYPAPNEINLNEVVEQIEKATEAKITLFNPAKILEDGKFNVKDSKGRHINVHDMDLELLGTKAGDPEYEAVAGTLAWVMQTCPQILDGITDVKFGSNKSIDTAIGSPTAGGIFRREIHYEIDEKTKKLKQGTAETILIRTDEPSGSMGSASTASVVDIIFHEAMHSPTNKAFTEVAAKSSLEKSRNVGITDKEREAEFVELDVIGTEIKMYDQPEGGPIEYPSQLLGHTARKKFLQLHLDENVQFKSGRRGKAALVESVVGDMAVSPIGLPTKKGVIGIEFNSLDSTASLIIEDSSGKVEYLSKEYNNIDDLIDNEVDTFFELSNVDDMADYTAYNVHVRESIQNKMLERYGFEHLKQPQIVSTKRTKIAFEGVRNVYPGFEEDFQVHEDDIMFNEHTLPEGAKTMETIDEALDKTTGYLERAKIGWNRFMEWFDIERSFKDLGFPEVGFHIKNFRSTRTYHEEAAISAIKRMAKNLGRDKTLMALTVLEAENPGFVDGLPLTEAKKGKVKEEARYWNEYAEQYKQDYINIGALKAGFKENLLERIDKQLSKAQTAAEKQEILKQRKQVEDMEFVHIPSTLWFDTLLERDPGGARRLLTVNARKRRKTFRIADLIEDGTLKLEDISIADVYASYGRRAGKDFALLNIANAAKESGLAFRTVLKGGKQYIEGTDTLVDEGETRIYRDPPPAAPIMRGYKVHPLMYDWLDEMTSLSNYQTAPQKFMSLIKMAQFIKPWIMPMIDIQQSLLLGSTWNVKSYVTRTYKALNEVINRGEIFKEASANGAFSKPFSSPLAQYKTQVDDAIKGMSRLLAPENIGPIGALKEIYKMSWYAAWFMDEVIRTSDYMYLKGKGYSERDAGQTSALYHGDYASVPNKTRHALNYIYFTPTFKLTMTKLLKRITESVYKDAEVNIKAVSSGNYSNMQISDLTKSVAYGGAYLLGAHMLLTSLGYDRDHFGWKYRKRVQTDQGPKDLVVGFSSPINMHLKYMYRAMDSLQPGVDNAASSFILRNKWEFQPTWTILYDTFISNSDGRGNTIYNEMDPAFIKGAKRMKYAVKNAVAVLDLYGEYADSKEARNAFAAEHGRVMEALSRSLAYKYMTTPKELQLLYRLKAVKSQYNKDMYKWMKSGKVPDEKVIRRNANELIRRIEQIEDEFNSIPTPERSFQKEPALPHSR